MRAACRTSGTSALCASTSQFNFFQKYHSSQMMTKSVCLFLLFTNKASRLSVSVPGFRCVPANKRFRATSAPHEPLLYYTEEHDRVFFSFSLSRCFPFFSSSGDLFLLYSVVHRPHLLHFLPIRKENIILPITFRTNSSALAVHPPKRLASIHPSKWIHLAPCIYIHRFLRNHTLLRYLNLLSRNFTLAVCAHPPKR